MGYRATETLVDCWIRPPQLAAHFVSILEQPLGDLIHGFLVILAWE
jgi:hypothetical protein